MNEIIEKHNFELIKKRLKEFSEKTQSELEIKRVEEDGWFFFDHNVTGKELNERLETIQRLFIDVNTTNNSVIKEFREVYNALDVLDRDYITAIMSNLSAIGKTSDDVRIQQRTLKKHNEKLNFQQKEIEKNILNIEKIVEVLKTFKEKLESYEHLMEIDEIWNDCKASRDKNIEISKTVEENKFLLEQLKCDIRTVEDKIKKLVLFMNHLEKLEHIDDIDYISKEVDKNSTKIVECKERVEELSVYIQSSKEEMNKLRDAIVERLDKKIRLLQWTTGGVFTAVIIGMILFVTKVIG
jgi:hypothetical protein